MTSQGFRPSCKMSIVKNGAITICGFATNGGIPRHTPTMLTELLLQPLLVNSGNLRQLEFAKTDIARIPKLIVLFPFQIAD